MIYIWLSVIKYSEYLSTLYVLYDGDLKVENGIVYLPLYMTTVLK